MFFQEASITQIAKFVENLSYKILLHYFVGKKDTNLIQILSCLI